MQASDPASTAAAAAAAAEPTSPSSAAAADANIERGLGRIDPEEILADEADPDVLLGRESDSESNFSKRNSAASARSTLSRPFTPPSALKEVVKAACGTADATASTVDVPGTPLANKRTPKTLADSKSITPSSSLDVPNTPTAPTHKSAPLDSAHVDDAVAAAGASNAADTIAKLEAHVLDLTAQVTGLNEKLVRSFERISDLEDDLSDAHARVSGYSVKVAELEKERQEHLAALNTGLLVEKAHVSSEMSKLMERVIEETAQRGKAESDKEKIERELDELSASLFNEANKMVAVERLARARAEQKSNNLEQSLKDTEALMLEQRKILESLQAQLDERRAMETNAAGPDGSAPDTASTLGSPSISLRELAPPRPIARAASVGTITGAGPHLARQVSPLILTNTVPFHEFMAFVRFLQKQRQSLAPFYNYPLYPKGQTGSSTDASIDGASSASTQSALATNPLMAGGLGLSHGLAGALGTAGTSAHLASGYARDSISPFAAAGLSRHRDYPTLPSNCESMVSITNQLSSIAFLKRAQDEDSEPALRLDLAPALSWLSRRSMQSSILEGTLVIEPVFPGSLYIDEQAIRMQNAHLPPAACALCGTGVVNVPLPAPGDGQGTASGSNGASGPSSGSTSSGWASSISAVTGGSRKDNTSSGTAQGGSGSSSSTPSASSGTLTSKSSLPSLFSSLRLGGSSRDKTVPSSSGTITEGGENGEDTSAPNTPSTPMQPAYLPVPTHIFRINETASQRYLLCPHHCLVRLRAVCAFWGYVRTLERSIVLEGKRPWEDGISSAAALGRTPPPLPSRSQTPEVVKATAATQQQGNAAIAEAGEPASEDKAQDSTASKVAEVAKGADEEETVPSTTESAPIEKEEAKAEASEKHIDEADSPSTQQTAVEETVAEEKTDSAPPAPAPKELKELSTTDATPTVSADASPRPTPPPLPARSTARRAAPPGSSSTGPDSGTSTPTAASSATKAGAGGTPIALAAPLPPPRRSIPMLTGAAALTAASASGPADGSAHAAANGSLVLSSRGTGALGWEERAWQEIVKLKEDMWKARVGVRDP